MDIIDKLLDSRGIADKDSFLNPDYDKKSNPFELSGMDLAVSRIKKAFEKKEKVTIYGDYDVDGITATVLVMESLKKFGFDNVDYFIPNRFDDGYGLNKNSLEKIIKSGAKLIVTVDCGSTSVKESAFLKENGVDLIITDHHEINLDNMPESIAIINPKKDNSENDFSGVGVAFKLIQALQTTLNGMPYGQEKWLLDLVAMGTICDSVVLRRENRANVFWGLKVMKKTRHIGLSQLVSCSRLSEESLDADAVGFIIGPRINAAGRLKNADIAVKTLMSDNSDEIRPLVQELENLNVLRRSLQDKIYKEAINKIDINDNVIVIDSDDWNKGVIGIVASKIVEEYQKPVFIITNDKNISSGSARSIEGVDIATIITTCKNEGLLIGGGGHKMAGGITLEKNNISKFKNRVNELCKLQPKNVVNKYKEDIEINLGGINLALVDELKKMEPFGTGNEKPIFKTKGATISDFRYVGAKDYLKLTVSDKAGNYFELISFEINKKNFFHKHGDAIDIWYSVSDNVWMGNRRVQGLLYKVE